jgi:ATP-dependent Clp protease, protease subunit
MSLRTLPELQAFDALAALQPEPDNEGFDETIRAADAPTSQTINLYGVIGRDPFTGEDNSERRVASALRAIGKKDVTVNLNSPGGSYFSGLAIYNLLRLHEARVIVNVLGMAGSAASVIAMAGDEVALGEGAHIMVHCASAVVAGNRFDLEPIIVSLGEVDDAMAGLYAARASVDKATAASWMNNERGNGRRFYAEEAIRIGLADKRLPKAAIKAEDPLQMPPERILERAALGKIKLPVSEVKLLVARLKGVRDATPMTARDAGFEPAAVQRLLSTLTT